MPLEMVNIDESGILRSLDSPGRPQDLRAVGMASRSVKLIWIPPANDKSPGLQYLLEYRREPRK